MNTKINISRKLEAVVPATLVNKHYMGLANPLGKWTATYFNVSRKKCLLVTNSTVKYTVIIEEITKSDFKEFTTLFIRKLQEQLKTDGIEIELEKLETIVGEVKLLETDNDRQTIGIQNSLNPNIEHWKKKFGQIDNWDFRYLTKVINGIPYKQIDWKTPREKMTQHIDQLISKI